VRVCWINSPRRKLGGSGLGCLPIGKSSFLCVLLPFILFVFVGGTQSETGADGSHHSMDIRGAYRELYEMMTEFLDQKWGRGGTVRGT
jgi:hypothetical protein